MFDEREFKEKLFAQNETNFYEFVSKYDERMVPVMKSRGYKCIHTMERTVVFTFGEFTFRRRRWKKGDKWVVPVDEKLGLKKTCSLFLGIYVPNRFALYDDALR